MPINEKVSVILPTFNESLNIQPLIDCIHNELKNYNHEILVIDDNSPDKTYQTALNLNYPYVKAIIRKENKGLANSIRCGLERAEGQIFIVMDSDFNHQPQYLPFMIQALLHYDCAFASRFLYGGSVNNRLRKILSRYFNVFIRFMTGIKIIDCLYGFFAIKREAIGKCRYDDIFWGYGDFCMRLLYFLQKNKESILQFPAINGERRKGKGNNKFFKIFCLYFIEVIKLAYKARIRS